MVRALIRVKCRGRNGNGTAAMPVASASSRAYMLLVKKTSETRSMLPRIRRPSATTAGMEDHLLSMSTIWATARVAGEPDPIAMPRSACLSARTSLTPSPVIATVWPSRRRAATMSCF